jgi:RNA polymerase primary sigma factor
MFQELPDHSVSPEFFSPDEMDNVTSISHDIDFEVTDSDEAGIPDKISGCDAREYGETEDLVQKYFHSISNISVLSRDEETELARRIEEGRNLIKEIVSAMPLFRRIEASLSNNGRNECLIAAEEDRSDQALTLSLKRLDSLMSKETVMGRDQIELESGMNMDCLISQWKKINSLRALISESKDKMITHNLRLVIKIAKYYIGRGFPLLDLIQEGNIGLMKAVDKFKYQKGFKFSTYGTWWIRQAITRAFIDQGKTIRIPVHMMDFYVRVSRASRELLQQLGREPSNEEIARCLEAPVKKIEEVFRVTRNPIALQARSGDEGKEVKDFVSDENSSPPDTAAEQREITEKIMAILNTLTPKEGKVIQMRFGIGVDRDYTLEEIGRKLSVTRERVRQIETKALRKLKHPKRLRKLQRLTTEDTPILIL